MKENTVCGFLFIVTNKFYLCVATSFFSPLRVVNKLYLHNGGCSLQADAGVLQLQNQQLVQQTDIQKHALQELEEKIRELKDRQYSYDDLLIAWNQHWIQVILYHHALVLLPLLSIQFIIFLFQK